MCPTAHSHVPEGGWQGLRRGGAGLHLEEVVGEGGGWHGGETRSGLCFRWQQERSLLLRSSRQGT